MKQSLLVCLVTPHSVCMSLGTRMASTVFLLCQVCEKQGYCLLPPLSLYNKVCMTCPQQQNHLNLEMANSYVTSQNATIRWDVITLPHIPILLHTHSWRCRWLPQLWESSYTFKCRSMWTQWTILVSLQWQTLTLKNSSLRSEFTSGSLHYSNGK